MKLQMLKRALIAYVSNSVKAVWSAVAHPLTIVGSKSGNVKDYKIYGNTINGVNVGAPDYHFTVVTRGKNYFDIDKVPFNSTTTKPYNNGMIATRVGTNIYSSRVPIDVPVGKKVSISFDVVDYTINGESTSFRVGFYDADGDTLYNPAVSVSKAHKTYSFTPKEKVANMRFYFTGASSTSGDSVTIDNIMIRTEGEDVWEPYVTPMNSDIYLNRLLASGDVIQMSVDGLPPLPQFNGTTTYEVMTDVPPSGMQVQYYG